MIFINVHTVNQNKLEFSPNYKQSSLFKDFHPSFFTLFDIDLFKFHLEVSFRSFSLHIFIYDYFSLIWSYFALSSYCAYSCRL